MTDHDRERPRINANVVNKLLRDAYGKGGMDEVLKVAEQCVSGVSLVQLRAIAKGEGQLVGISPGPIEFIPQ